MKLRLFLNYVTDMQWNAGPKRALFAILALPLFSAPALASDSIYAKNEHRHEARSDTLLLRLSDAEALFLERNVLLAAERLNVDVDRARIRQERLWQNPQVELEHQIVNRQGSGPIGFSDSDNSIVEIEQLVFDAGRRRQSVRLRAMEMARSEMQFDRFLRESKRFLREQFVALWFVNRQAGLYESQIEALERVLAGFQEQHEQGNVARMEVMRLRSLLYELTTQYHEALRERDEKQDRLALLLHLHDQTPVALLPETVGTTTTAVPVLQRDDLVQAALRARPEMLAVRQSVAISEQELRVERREALPEVGMGLVYDRLDGPAEPYVGLTMNVTVPLWNRNQGTIQAQRHRVRQEQMKAEYVEQEVMRDVDRARKRLERSMDLLERVEDRFEEDYSSMIDQLLQRYEEGALNLIEFIDFYESFREAMIRTWQIQREFLDAIGELNFSVGAEVVPMDF